MEDHSRGSENPRSLLVSEWREILSTGASEVDKCQIGEPLRSKGASEVHHSHKKHPQNSLKTQRLLVPESCAIHCVGIDQGEVFVAQVMYFHHSCKMTVRYVGKWIFLLGHIS